MKLRRLVCFLVAVSLLLPSGVFGVRSQPVSAQSMPQTITESDKIYIRVYYQSMDEIEKLTPFDLLEFNNLEESYVLVLGVESTMSEIEALGFKVAIDEERTSELRNSLLAPAFTIDATSDYSINTIPSYSCYRTVEETYAAAQALAVNYPNLASWFDVGDSWQKAIGPLAGYDMMVLKLTNKAFIGEKPVLFLTASIHAREYAPAEIATRFAEHLVSNYGIDPDITWILDYHEIHIMFHANPDGRKIAETGSSWRKNRDNDDGCSTTYGVDLNRNFTYQWGTGGSSTNPCDETYRGPSAGSEPETQAIQAYISAVFNDQRGTGAAPADAEGVYIDMHSSGGYVMWPWGYTTTTPPNNTQLQTMGRKLAYFNGYTPGQITRVLYVASGGSVDYAYGEMGVATYAFEVGSQFFEPCTSFLSSVYPTNLNALLYASKVARTPYMTPLGPDSLNLALSANTVAPGTTVTLTAQANDTRYKSGTGEAVQTIVAAEYYIDTPPWVGGATAIAMTASDGSFNATTETVIGLVNTGGLSNGRHTLFIRSRDAANNWGAVSAIFLTVEGTANQAPVISQGDTISVTMSEDGNPIAFTIIMDAVDPEGNPLTWSLAGAASNGTASVSGSGASPLISYTPNANYFGSDSFIVQVTDGYLFDSITVNVTLQSVNDAPIAHDQTVSTSENTAKAIALSGSDIDGGSLTFTVLTQPVHGTLSGTLPNQTYTPAANYSGPDSFTFKVNDGQVDSNAATVTISVSAVNDPPVANAQSVSTPEDAAIAITLTGSDPDGDGLTYLVVTPPTRGALSGTAPNLTYTPAANYNGSDNFTFKVNDGQVDSNAATVTISVSAVNDPPVANAQSVSTPEDAAIAITLTGSDIDGDSPDFTVITQPGTGTLSGIAPNLTYTPAANYYGPDSFTFKVNDGQADSTTATVTITVTPVNDAPVANAQTVSTPEDTALGITLGGSDVEGSNLTFTVLTQPLHGGLSGSGSNLTYTPAENYNGADSFTFKVNDGTVDSNTATVIISVTPVNDAPVADPLSVVTSQNTAIATTLTGQDVDGDPLIFSVLTGPAHGSLSGTGSDLTYTPTSDYVGSDSFSFSVTDGSASSQATVTITVTQVNHAPVAQAQSVETSEDLPVTITLVASDSDGNPLSYSVIDPAHGNLSGTAPNLTYTPAANYNGQDSFTFKVNDGLVDSNTATVSITVSPVNDTPVANAQSVTTPEDTAKAIALSGSDIDGNTLTYSIVTPPAHGNLTDTAPNLTYTPAANYNGPDTFTFKVNDGLVDSIAVAVTISVSPDNDAPVANAQSITTPEETAKAITLSGSDIDGNTLTYSIVTQPANGTLSGTGANRTYTPSANFNGSDSFTFKVNDGTVDSTTAIVTITVTPVNDAPVAIAQSVSTPEDTAKTIILAGSDVEGSNITFTVLSQPAHGALGGSAPNLTFTPTANYNGADSFTFKVSDGALDSGTATISISVTAVNDAPVANPQSLETFENAQITITLTGSDVDAGTTLTYTVTSQPSHGSLLGSGANWIYTPVAYYNGSDSFTFTVSDGVAGSVPASVTINILSVNYLPLVLNQSLVTTMDTPLSILLSGTDPDSDELTFEIVSGPIHGVLNGGGTNFTYTPAAGFTGPDSFTYHAFDGTEYSDSGLVEILVNPSGPLTVFWDDFESNLGWTRNAYGTDTATLGYFERANPETSVYNGDKQLGTTVSGSYDLVTGPLFGSSAGAYDLDGGSTSMRSPAIQLPTGRELNLSFSYYLSHYTNSSSADYLRVKVIGANTQQVFEELGAANDDDATWVTFSADISAFAGQSVYILVEAGDMSTASFVEAAVDDVLIMAANPNLPPVSSGQNLVVTEDTSLAIQLLGSDPEGSSLTYSITQAPAHGSLSGSGSAITYLPSANYFGTDSFAFVVNDGKLNSDPATVNLEITSINDKPVANPASLSITFDTPSNIFLTGTDVEGAALTFTIVAPPTHGVISGTGATYTYTPNSGYVGADGFQFTVSDGELTSGPALVSINVLPAGPTTVFFDDFESDQGWIRNPYGTDTASLGRWERADPQTVSYYGYKQLGTTVSGSFDLVTGPLAGSNAGAYDLDGGMTSMRSPAINLPSGRNLTFTFSYYFAHYTNSSTSDYLRVSIVGDTTSTVLQEFGANNDDDAVWTVASLNLNDFAGQTVYILIEATDAGSSSFVEAAVDDVLVVAN